MLTKSDFCSSIPRSAFYPCSAFLIHWPNFQVGVCNNNIEKWFWQNSSAVQLHSYNCMVTLHSTNFTKGERNLWSKLNIICSSFSLDWFSKNHQDLVLMAFLLLVHRENGSVTYHIVFGGTKIPPWQNFWKKYHSIQWGTGLGGILAV